MERAPESAAKPGPGLDLPTPAQLPADLPDFTGRDRLIAELARGLTADGPTRLIAVNGLGGVGKTALAIRAAHAVIAAFPDGQLFADLRGTDSDPASATSVLAGFLRALGIPDGLMPSETGERAALLRTALSGRRMLMVLDNARDADQVQPLLPGTSGCATLITSRARLSDLAAADHVDLGELTEGEAIRLLARIAGAARIAAEPAATAEVVTACGRLPIALRVAASRLASRPHWTMAGLAARLSDPDERLDELRIGGVDVASVFQLSYRQLDITTARAFRLLALPDCAALSPATAAVVLDMPQREAEQVCERLVDVQLLQAGPRGYHYHSLVRLYARHLAATATSDVDAVGMRRRLIHHHLANVHAAILALNPAHPLLGHLLPADDAGLSFARAAEVHAWIAGAHHELTAVLRDAVSAGLSLLPLLVDLLTAMILVKDIAVYCTIDDVHAGALLDVLPEVESARTGGRMRFVVGHWLAGQSRMDEAENMLMASVALAAAAGDIPVQAAALQQAATIASERGRPSDAVPRLQEALSLMRHAGQRMIEAALLAYLAGVHVRRGALADAADAGEQAIAITQAMGDGHLEAYVRLMLGEAILDDEPSLAAQHLSDSVRLWRARGHLAWMARALGVQTAALQAAGRPDEAIAVGLEAVELMRICLLPPSRLSRTQQALDLAYQDLERHS